MICPSCHEPLNYPSGDGCAAMKLHKEEMTKARDAKKKADALLKAGDALAETFPARSRELLRLCRHYRNIATELEK